MDILHNVIEGILQVAAASAATYGVMLLHKVFVKLHLNISADREAQLQAYTQKFIIGLEEKGAARALAGLPKLSGGQKIDAVIAEVAKVLPNVSTDDVINTIHAVLPSTNNGALVKKS